LSGSSASLLARLTPNMVRSVQGETSQVQAGPSSRAARRRLTSGFEELLDYGAQTRTPAATHQRTGRTSECADPTAPAPKAHASRDAHATEAFQILHRVCQILI
jgi:hypothetical protein